MLSLAAAVCCCSNRESIGQQRGPAAAARNQLLWCCMRASFLASAVSLLCCWGAQERAASLGRCGRRVSLLQQGNTTPPSRASVSPFPLAVLVSVLTLALLPSVTSRCSSSSCGRSSNALSPLQQLPSTKPPVFAQHLRLLPVSSCDPSLSPANSSASLPVALKLTMRPSREGTGEAPASLARAEGSAAAAGAPAAAAGAGAASRAWGGMRHHDDREQYISKIPSSSFLRALPERTDKLNAADALVAVPVSEQQRLVDRFVEFSEQVRGAQLHLLRELEGSSAAHTFGLQVADLQETFAAADAAAGVRQGEHVGDGSGEGLEEQHRATSEEHMQQLPSRPQTVLFRIIEGGVSLSPSSSSSSSPKAATGAFFSVHAAAGADAEGSTPDSSGSSSSVNNSSSFSMQQDCFDGRHESLSPTVAFPGQLQSFLQLAENEIATKSVVGWTQEAADCGAAAAVQLRRRRVVLAGALTPLALDETLVIEHKVTLRVNSRGSSGEASSRDTSSSTPPNSRSSDVATAAADLSSAFERLTDVLHLHAYQGRLRAAAPEQIRVQRGGRRGSWSQAVDTSVAVLARADEPRYLSIFYHFRDGVEASFMLGSPEWKALQSALAPLLVSRKVSAFRGILHSRREQTGLCTGPFNAHEPLFTSMRAPRDTFDWASQLDGSAVVQADPKLQGFVPMLRQRFEALGLVISSLEKAFGSLENFAQGRRIFGLNRVQANGISGWQYREWLPNAKAAYLFGDFNNWNRSSHPLHRERRGVSPHFFEASFASLKGAPQTSKDEQLAGEGLSAVWSIFLPDKPDGTPVLTHKSLLRVGVVPYEGEAIDRVPAWAQVVWKSKDFGLFNAVVWDPPESERHAFRYPRPSLPVGLAPAVYEAHIGASSGEEGRVGNFVEFTETVLPRIKNLGYNALLLLDVVECADFASFGVYVTNHFAVSSRLGTVEEFKALVDRAHALGLLVLVSLCHAHSSKNVMDGLGCIDGGDASYFVGGPSGEVEDARVFDFSKTEVVRFLLSNLYFWLTEFNLDGFRMEGVTWMLYANQSVCRQPDPSDYSTYFTRDLSSAGVLYLSLANSLALKLLPSESDNCLLLAQESTGFPTLCRPVAHGGLGFSHRVESDWPQQLRRVIKQSGHRQGRWITAHLLWSLANRPNTEKVIAAAEDADTTRICRRRMRIALFAWESLHTHAVGGVAPHVTELAAALARQGHCVHVFVRALESCGGCSVHYGVTYHECTFELDRDFVREIHNMCESFIACMLSVEEAMGAQFEICHAHDWLAARALVRAKQMGRSSVLTMHSTEFGRCGNNNYGGVSKQIRDIEAEACHVADRVICVSGVLAEEVGAQYGVHPAKMAVIYNGINCSKFDGEVDPGAVKQAYGVGALEPMFLFVGRMAVQKGPDLLLEAVPFIQKFRGDAKFVFVGDGHMLASLRNRAAQLGVAHTVRFVGKMGGGALHALFKSCDAVVVPSRNEPFGIVVLEAWSAAKPVVATNSGGPRDFVNPHVTGILVDPTPGSIAWGCCEILKNFEHARWMGSRGRVTAAFSFSWDSIAHKTRDIYYEQRNKHDAPPNWTNSSEGDETLAFALIGPAMYEHMSVEDCDPHVVNGLSVWRLYHLLGSALADGKMNFMANEFAHPDALDLPRPANHFAMQRAFRRWTLAQSPHLKFTQCELFDCCVNHWAALFRWPSASHLYVVTCDEEAQVVVVERGPCLFAFNFHPHASYEGYHVGCMYSEPLRLFFDSDEQRFGGFGRLTPLTQHPVSSPKDSRPHSVKVYLPSSTCAVYVQESTLNAKQGLIAATPVLTMHAEAYVEYRNIDRSPKI
ncbi:hypothetical protein Esti_000820 [Eimeria stiedai]